MSAVKRRGPGRLWETGGRRRTAGRHECRGGGGEPRAQPAARGLPQLKRQIGHGERGSVGHHDGALDHVLELANIARPVIRHQRLDRVRIKVGDQLSDAIRVDVQEIQGQLEDVLAPIAQGRCVKTDHVEPVVQVFAKPAGPDQGLEVLMGRRQDPDIDGDGLRAADALKRHFLQDAEQLGLDFQVDVADLVEKKCAAVGLLKTADAVAVCSGESTLDVSEKLAFQQARRQGRAMELDERPGCAGLA